jgi:uncharacterized membrane protein
MSIANGALTAQARAALKWQWKQAILAFVIFAAVSVLLPVIPFFGWILSLLAAGPLLVGFNKYFLRFYRREQVDFAQLFDGFSCFAPSFVAWLLCAIFIFLWSLLLIVPGIIAALSYSMTYFIIADNPEIDGVQAMRKSKEMMRGHRWKLFCFGCRFIGWFFLCLLSLGIGFFWLGPYWMTGKAAFYQDLLTAPETVTVEAAATRGPIIIP